MIKIDNKIMSVFNFVYVCMCSRFDFGWGETKQRRFFYHVKSLEYAICVSDKRMEWELCAVQVTICVGPLPNDHQTRRFMHQRSRGTNAAVFLSHYTINMFYRRAFFAYFAWCMCVSVSVTGKTLFYVVSMPNAFVWGNILCY